LREESREEIKISRQIKARKINKKIVLFPSIFVPLENNVSFLQGKED